MSQSLNESNSISFNASRTSVGYMTLGFGGFLAAVFIIAGVLSVQGNNSLVSSALAIALGLFLVVVTIWNHRYWLDRTMIITANGNHIIVEVHLRNKVLTRQQFSAGQIESAYTVRIWGRGPMYEVWLKLHNGRDVMLVFTWYSQSDAIAMRHFIADHLHVREVTGHVNRFLG